ncbi:hypothetical protein VOLCADRAFT_101016 [Volvox carteri f. nagariensis]|uniref:Reverse transcriptase domain-containing protein n=1 Tax=Volvox carteri f. nagariensis TaxID=3068 RepID=D8ULJ5_VOLCA|nr:uncharacterized protein VOLCADRAFT_101016 [Volvox carteri f. nagariensis]EFJ39404.1 hypothetical protein VOLCADRAFT_101016 [Volvox carteri f. nagariensis]|eukprot:XP_002959531.1 hypothetical protein VOLCADRAFT_101016 [Volvox carteri f. nagariensis]
MFTPKQGAIGGRSRTSRLRVTANYSWPCLLGPRETPSLQQYMHNVFFPVSQTGRPSRPGARVLPYLDDFLIMFTSEEQARFCARWVREMIEFLGLSCHPTKCQWEPSQSVYHLGITVNTAAGVFEVTKQKLAKLWWLAIGLRITAKKNQRLVQKCELAKFCSFAQSIKLALTPALLFLRNCYDDVKQPVWQCGCSRSVGAFAWHSVGQCGGAIAGSCAPEWASVSNCGVIRRVGGGTVVTVSLVALMVAAALRSKQLQEYCKDVGGSHAIMNILSFLTNNFGHSCLELRSAACLYGFLISRFYSTSP